MTPPPFGRAYVISLSSSTERREYIMRHLPGSGLERFEFHMAVDANDEAVKQLYVDNKVAVFPPCFRCGKVECGDIGCNNALIPPQVATFLSHLSLWIKIAAGDEFALVCEDDVVLHPWWQDVMTMIADAQSAGLLPAAPSHPVCVRLGWAESDEHSRDEPLRLTREVRMSNPCYLMSPGYADMLIKEFDGVWHTADVFAHQYSRAAKSYSWTAHPPAATELSWSRGEVASHIHPKPIRSAFLRSLGREKEALEHDRNIREHIKHMFQREFLIVGHPRCGTGFTAKLLCQLGFDIGHEADGRDGLASWMFAVDGQAPFAQDPIACSRQALIWSTLIMPVRDIQTAVPSIMKDNIYSPLSYDYRRRNILSTGGCDLNELPNNFQRAVASLLHWNRLIECMHPQLAFRIECDAERLRDLAVRHAGKELPQLCQLKLEPVNSDKPYRGKRRSKPQITDGDWASLSDQMWQDVVEYCQRYGYELPKRSIKSAKIEHAPQVSLSDLTGLFLAPSGWARSAAEARPVRADGSPLPWFTYGAIEFLEQILRSTDRVFEYGAGLSTLWWQSRVKSITSVEHDEGWIACLSPELTENTQLRHSNRHMEPSEDHKPIVDDYHRRMHRTSWPDYDVNKVVRRGLVDDGFEHYAASIMESLESYDIIIIDGMARRLCCEFAIKKLSHDGVIVLDNSNRRDYDAAYDILEESGFRQISFWGLVPGASFYTCTSIFVRTLCRLPSAAHHSSTLALPEY